MRNTMALALLANGTSREFNRSNQELLPVERNLIVVIMMNRRHIEIVWEKFSRTSIEVGSVNLRFSTFLRPQSRLRRRAAGLGGQVYDI
jgi:hypothetical protein